jgi:hypothetical protein
MIDLVRYMKAKPAAVIVPASLRYYGNLQNAGLIDRVSQPQEMRPFLEALVHPSPEKWPDLSGQVVTDSVNLILEKMKSL